MIDFYFLEGRRAKLGDAPQGVSTVLGCERPSEVKARLRQPPASGLPEDRFPRSRAQNPMPHYVSPGPAE